TSLYQCFQRCHRKPRCTHKYNAHINYFFNFAKVQIILNRLNFPFYLASRITRNSQRTFSKLIVRVAVSTVAVGVAAMILAIAVLNGFKNEVSSKQRGFFGDISVTGISSYNQWEQQPIYLDSTIQRSLLHIQ